MMTKTKLFILSDAIGVGKTTALQKWTKTNKNTYGYLSPVINGKRMFQNIKTGTLIPMETASKDLAVGKYHFDKKSFETVVQDILRYYSNTETKLIILDEIGPLEIYKKKGFHDLLMQLKTENTVDKPKLFFVVRAACLDDFLITYNFKNEKIFNLNEFKSNFNTFK